MPEAWRNQQGHGQEDCKDVSSRVSHGEENLPAWKDQGEINKPKAENVTDDSSVRELADGKEAVKITSDKPAFISAGPSRKFKRPKSYIRGREKHKHSSDCSGHKQEREKARAASKPETHPGSFLSREEQEQAAALKRINYLHKRLKKQENTRDYFKSYPEEHYSAAVLRPDPPVWSYESYSESEQQEASLSGLKSYIRATKGRKDRITEDGEIGKSPHESLVTYLDGVLTSRYPVRKCSMTLDPCSDDSQTQGSNPDHHRRRGEHDRRSPRRPKGSPRDRRLGSRESVRRLEIGVCREQSDDSALDEGGGEYGTTMLGWDGNEMRKLQVATEEIVEPKSVNGKAHFEAPLSIARQTKGERSSASSVVHEKSHETSGYTINTRQHVRPDNDNNSRQPTEKSVDSMKWEEEERRRAVSKIISGNNLNLIETNSDLNPCGLPVSVSAHTLDKDTMAPDRETLVFSSQPNPNPVRSVADLLRQSGRGAPPLLQAQRRPLAVDDGYVVPVGDGEDHVEPPARTFGDGERHKSPKRRRLVVQKDRACAKIWSSSKTLQRSEQPSISRLIPHVEYGTGDDGLDYDSGGEEDEDMYDEDGDGEYEDLIIQTELAEGSKVTVSNSDGPIADIEHRAEDVSDIKQYQVMSYTPETGQIDILNDHVLNKSCNKSQNNGRYDSSDASSIETRRPGQTKRYVDDRDCRYDRKAKGSSKIETKHKTPPRPKTDVENPQQKMSNGSPKTRRTNSTLSPPKPLAAPSPEIRRREGSVRMRRYSKSPLPVEVTKPKDNEDEIEIPMGHDGKTRVLLVLRTPPKKSRDGERDRHSRRSLEMRVRSASSTKQFSPKRSPPKRAENVSSPSPGIEKPKSTPRATENIDHNAHKGFDHFDSVMRDPLETGEKLSARQIINGTSSIPIAQQAGSPRTKRPRSRSPRKRLDSLVPTHCGQDGDGRVEIQEEGGLRNFVEKIFTRDKTVPPDDAHEISAPEPSETAEQTNKSHGPCRFSVYQPCSHGENDDQLKSKTSRTKSPRKPYSEEIKKPKKIAESKDPRSELGQCSFSRFQPCNHSTHTPCQFDPFKPCQHEECEETDEPQTDLASDVLDAVAPRKQESARRSGYVYNSKKLQDKLGAHSPCVFDRYKPCHHEEVVGPLRNIKNKAVVSLLSHAAKQTNKSDTKSKAKDTNLDPYQCKFNRYTPCHHEHDIKYNKALGRKLSLQLDKAKSRPPEVQDAPAGCRFSRFKPCFCRESAETANGANIENKAVTEEEPSSQQLQFDGKTGPLREKKTARYGGDLATLKEKIESSGAGARPKDTAPGSAQEGAKGKGKRSTKNELTAPAADGTGVSTSSKSPRGQVSTGAGDGDIIKRFTDDDRAEDEGEQAGTMSLMTRLTRAWFSSAQAQVARLTPPQRVMVAPSLRPDAGLGCSAGLQGSITVPEQVANTVNNNTVAATNNANTNTAAAATMVSTGAAAATLGAVAEPYNSVQKPQSISPSNQLSAACDGDTNPSMRRGTNDNAQQTSNEENPFKQQRVYELSLGDPYKTCASSETDASQVTEMPSCWTFSSSRLHGSGRPVNVGVRGNKRSTVTETCSGQAEHHPVSHQLWTRADGVPENFLVLTSNVYPVGPEGGDIGDTPRRAESGQEVRSADPLPVHFSDVARAKRTGNVGGDKGRRLLKDDRGKAGLTLCHSPQRHHTSNSWASDDPGNLPARGAIDAVLGQDRCLNHADDEVDVGTFLKRQEAFCPGGGDSSREERDRVAENESPAGYTTQGEVCADPLFASRRPKTSRTDKRSVDKYRIGNSSHLDCAAEEKASKMRFLKAEVKPIRKRKDAILGQDYVLEVCDDRESRALCDQPKHDRLSPRTDLSSKERQAVVVAAAELGSYKSLLDTINKIARVDPSGISTRDGQGVPSGDTGVISSRENLDGCSTDRSHRSRRHHRSSSSSACTSDCDTPDTSDEEFLDACTESDVNPSESATGSEDDGDGRASPDLFGDSSQNTRSRSRRDSGRLDHEMYVHPTQLDVAQPTIVETGDQQKISHCHEKNGGPQLPPSEYEEMLDAEDLADPSMANIVFSCRTLTTRDGSAGVVQNVSNSGRNALEKTSLSQMGSHSKGENNVALFCSETRRELGENVNSVDFRSCEQSKSAEEQSESAGDELSEESSEDDDDDSSDTRDSDDSDAYDEDEEDEEEDEESEKGEDEGQEI